MAQNRSRSSSGVLGVARELQHPVVEVDPRQLAVQVQREVLGRRRLRPSPRYARHRRRVADQAVTRAEAIRRSCFGRSSQLQLAAPAHRGGLDARDARLRQPHLRARQVRDQLRQVGLVADQDQAAGLAVPVPQRRELGRREPGLEAAVLDQRRVEHRRDRPRGLDRAPVAGSSRPASGSIPITASARAASAASRWPSSVSARSGMVETVLAVLGGGVADEVQVHSRESIEPGAGRSDSTPRVPPVLHHHVSTGQPTRARGSARLSATTTARSCAAGGVAGACEGGPMG